MSLARPFLLGLALLAHPGDGPAPPTPGKSLPDPAPPNILSLVFAYGSEKKGWVDEVTRDYNEAHHAVGGRPVRVEALPMGSGEIIERLLKPDGDPAQLKAHLISPASAAFVTIGNGEAREAGGKDLVGEVRDLVRSPLVLAMWADLAEASGWRAAPPAWAEVFGAARDPEAWKAATRGKAGVPPLLLGHTDPERSNSGLLALILMVESSTPAPRAFEGGLTRGAVLDPSVAEALRSIQARVARPLDSSTGFLAGTMLKAGPEGMGAALVYENLVIEKNRAAGGVPRLVAIYPKEGTFANEHPIGVVRRAWVTDEHAGAAKDYTDFLRARPQQEKAKAHGFRPSDPSIPIDDLLRPEYGVLANDMPPLAYPNAQMIKEIRGVWKALATAPARQP